jgi:hypothetical protein
MAIPLAQCETWTNQGATTTAEATHVSIRHALTVANSSSVSAHDIDIFLQGSYRNVTNIYSDSDVDVVVLLNETYTRDVSRLAAWEQQAEQNDYSPATYPWATFKQDVVTSLRRYYGQGQVIEGNKAVNVLGGNGRLAADVVPAIEHKLYTAYGTTIATPTNSVDGVSFRDRAGRLIVNYPKQHIANGEAKNAAGRTYGHYKPTVRMFKNARRYLVEKGRLPDGLAPSYFVECLLYNVPDNLFAADRTTAMQGILQWLLQSNKAGCWCQNEQVPLFGLTPEQWRLPSADQMITAMAVMWIEWPI